MTSPATIELRSWPLPVALDLPTVVAAVRRRGPVVALESALPSRDRGGQSFVAGVPLAIFQWDRGAPRIDVVRPAGAPCAEGMRVRSSPFHTLESALGALKFTVRGDERAPPLPAFGFFGYECAAAAACARFTPFPDAWFLLTDTVVHWPRPGAAPRLWSGDARLGEELAGELAALKNEAHATAPRASAAAPRVARKPVAELDASEYAAKFALARAALARGDSYQLCFTYPIERDFAGDPLDLHRQLRRENAAPFAAYLEAPFGALVSSSPERFLSVDAAGRVEARPMKGTAVRPDDAAERARVASELVASAKIRAENLMIADLLRNDLGRVCRIGSVHATRPALIEEYATLLQLVSVIEGELADGRSRADLLASAFPPGSMTGAPKKRSIGLLRELEAGPRGPYAGALGYWSSDGRLDLSVVIRTLLVAAGRARVNVGSGIVWDSDAASEHAECRAKAAALLAALASCAARSAS